MIFAAPAPAKSSDLIALLTPNLAAADWLGRADAFAGIDAMDRSLFAYAGFTLAPGGLDRDGLRFRAFAGSGSYTYTSRTEISPGVLVAFDRRAEVLQAEALIGWRAQTGALTAKLFAGLAYESQTVTPVDPENALAGTHFGAKIAVESWLDLSRYAWLSADASYSTTIDAYSGAVKLGLRPASWLSLGPSVAAFGDREFSAHRLGAFARWHRGGHDVTVSGGISGDYDDETGAYGALSVYTRF